jgi:DNA-binding LacI/PurR family transcriptional regulator
VVGQDQARPRAQRVTGQDVAERAGVSRATVSYVLNDVAGQPISTETRGRVLAAAADLDYTPHAAARQLRTGVSDLILMALPAWPFSLSLSLCVSTVTQRLGEHGYTALVDPAAEEAANLENTLARLQPIALTASSEQLSAPLVARLRSAGTRAVVGFGDRPLGFAPTVVIDQSAVSRVAMAHLSDRGHRSVVAVMPSDPAYQWFRTPRQAGAEAAAAEHDMSLTVVESRLDPDHVAEVLGTALAGPATPDAVLAYNDDFALLALRALVDAGARVPDDIAVIGCDNLPVAELFTPRLTTIEVDMRVLGTLIADTLHQMLTTGEGPDVVPIPPPVVIVRDSV